VKLTLTPQAIGQRHLTRAILHRQGGALEELPLTQCGNELALEMKLSRWEVSVIALR
jgi:hypothetical protein